MGTIDSGSGSPYGAEGICIDVARHRGDADTAIRFPHAVAQAGVMEVQTGTVMIG
jgi:hypothetical protein